MKQKSRHRILYCSIGLATGGEQKQLIQILQNLDKQHYEPVLCCIRPFHHVDEAIAQSGITLLSLGIQNHRNLPLVVSRLREVIKRYRIDLLHIGIFGSEYQGLLAAISARKPVVAVLQSSFDLTARYQASKSTGFFWRYKWRIFYALHGFLARIGKVKYVALSEAIKQSAVAELHLPEKRIAVIPLGLNPEEFDIGKDSEKTIVQIREELSLDKAYPVLLNVARLSPAKNQSKLLEAMPIILEHLPQAKLLIAGDGPLLSDLATLRDSLKLQKEVYLLGQRDDIKNLLIISDIFVFSSYYEGLPGAVIEAMAAAKPVVSFDIPSVREIVKDGYSGVLVKQRDAVSFAHAVVQLAEKPEIARVMGIQAQQIVKKRFDIRQNIRDLEHLYEGMITSPRVK
jgi:glycosyltransferase involved in cell wall biosynthesis